MSCARTWYHPHATKTHTPTQVRQDDPYHYLSYITQYYQCQHNTTIRCNDKKKLVSCLFSSESINSFLYHTPYIIYTILRISSIPFSVSHLYHTPYLIYTILRISSIPYSVSHIYHTPYLIYTILCISHIPYSVSHLYHTPYLI